MSKSNFHCSICSFLFVAYMIRVFEFSYSQLHHYRPFSYTVFLISSIQTFLQCDEDSNLLGCDSLLLLKKFLIFQHIIVLSGSTLSSLRGIAVRLELLAVWFLQNVTKHLRSDTVSYSRNSASSEYCKNLKSCMKLPYLSTLLWRLTSNSMRGEASYIYIYI